MSEFKYFEFRPHGGVYFDKENADIMFQYMDALEAENAELRKHIKMPDEPLEINEKDFYVRAFIKWAIEEQPELKRLEAENAKLRELLGDFRNTMWDGGEWTEPFDERMRELGIEVD